MTQEILSILNATGTSAILRIGPNGELAKQFEAYCQEKGRTLLDIIPVQTKQDASALSEAVKTHGVICMDANQDWPLLYELLLHCEEYMKEHGVHPVFIFYSLQENTDLHAATSDFLAKTGYSLYANAQKNTSMMVASFLLEQNMQLAECLKCSDWKKDETMQKKADNLALPKAEAHIRFLQSIRIRESLNFGQAWEIVRQDETDLREKYIESRAFIERMMRSKSWKLTTPLRHAGAWMRQLIHPTQEGGNMLNLSPVAVIIPCHNYGHYLAECIESVLTQTRVPQEIVVVDDASTDSTAEIAASLADNDVHYLRGEWNNVGESRNAGAAATNAPYLLFLDADDFLSADYIEKCLEKMQDPTAAVAYGHPVRFGNRNHFVPVPEYDREVMMKRNFISSHAMIRRQAFDMVGGYRACHFTHEDWDLYRRVLQFQWKAARADTHLYYRAHDDSKFYRAQKTQGWNYAKRAFLHHQPVTIFTPFAGREALLDDYMDALRSLDFDPQFIRLHCFDTSGNTEFGQRLKDAIASLPFGRTTYTSAPHPDLWNHTPESLIKLRMSNKQDAQYYYEMAVVNAYNHFIKTCDTEFGLTVEDDILLSPDALKTMLSTVEEDVSAIVVPYRCHMHKYWLVWDNDANGKSVHPHKKETGIRAIGGSGFGCSLFRMSALKKMPIYTLARWQEGQWYDHIAFDHLWTQGRVLCNWDVPIEHVYTERHIDKTQGVLS